MHTPRIDRVSATAPCRIAVMPLFHTGGCVCTIIAAVSKQATIVLVEAFDPGLALELFGTYHGTAMLGVPTMLVAMMEHPDFASADLSHVEAICSGGSLVPAPMVRRLEETLGAPFTIVFGQTESSPVSSMTQPTDTIADKAGTIGPPMPGVEVKIVDPETGRHRGDRCGRRVLHPRLPRDARLLREPRRDRRRRSTRTAGCTPVTFARWTSAGTARSRGD